MRYVALAIAAFAVVITGCTHQPYFELQQAAIQNQSAACIAWTASGKDDGGGYLSIDTGGVKGKIPIGIAAPKNNPCVMPAVVDPAAGDRQLWGGLADTVIRWGIGGWALSKVFGGFGGGGISIKDSEHVNVETNSLQMRDFSGAGALYGNKTAPPPETVIVPQQVVSPEVITQPAPIIIPAPAP